MRKLRELEDLLIRAEAGLAVVLVLTMLTLAGYNVVYRNILVPLQQHWAHSGPPVEPTAPEQGGASGAAAAADDGQAEPAAEGGGADDFGGFGGGLDDEGDGGEAKQGGGDDFGGFGGGFGDDDEAGGEPDEEKKPEPPAPEKKAGGGDFGGFGGGFGEEDEPPPAKKAEPPKPSGGDDFGGFGGGFDDDGGGDAKEPGGGAADDFGGFGGGLGDEAGDGDEGEDEDEEDDLGDDDQFANLPDIDAVAKKEDTGLPKGGPPPEGSFAAWGIEAVDQLKIEWIDVFLRQLVIIVAFLGASLATQRGKHINIDALSRLLPDTARRWVPVALHLVSLTVCLMLASAGWDLVKIGQEFPKDIVPWAKEWQFQLMFPVGFGLLAAHFGVRVLEAVGGGLSGAGPRDPRGAGEAAVAADPSRSAADDVADDARAEVAAAVGDDTSGEAGSSDDTDAETDDEEGGQDR